MSQLCTHKHGPPLELTAENALPWMHKPGPAPIACAGPTCPSGSGRPFRQHSGKAASSRGQRWLSARPVDLRANTLKTTRDKLITQLAKFNAKEGPLGPDCIRIDVPDGCRRTPNLEAEPAFQRGYFEIQDAASQAAALLVDAQPGMQVADICAGGGGKTLALAASMQNKGQLFAWDADRNRLKPIIARLNRAGVRNAQVIPADEVNKLDEHAGRFDRVLVDAPCTGSGSWRRKPDAKWRLTPESLENRRNDQRAVLAHAARLVKPGGRVVYVTCSVLPEENHQQIEWFLAAHEGFSVVPFADCLAGSIAHRAPGISRWPAPIRCCLGLPLTAQTASS
jgi:16S rRNA (cytosine967-C5)-methyltransferase